MEDSSPAPGFPVAWPLHDAAAAGDGQRLASLLAEGQGAGSCGTLHLEAALAQPDALGFLPLFYATAFGREEAAAVLLAAGAPSVVHATHQLTAAHAAAATGSLRVLRVLSAHGCLELQTPVWATPNAAPGTAAPGVPSCLMASQLALALRPHVAGSLPGLLDGLSPGHSGGQGAGRGLRDLSLGGLTPLHLAAACGQTEAASLLLGEGASVRRRAHAPGVPLELLTSQSHEEYCLVGGTPLHAAALSGDAECWKLLCITAQRAAGQQQQKGMDASVAQEAVHGQGGPAAAQAVVGAGAGAGEEEGQQQQQEEEEEEEEGGEQQEEGEGAEAEEEEEEQWHTTPEAWVTASGRTQAHLAVLSGCLGMLAAILAAVGHRGDTVAEALELEDGVHHTVDGDDATPHTPLEVGAHAGDDTTPHTPLEVGACRVHGAADRLVPPGTAT